MIRPAIGRLLPEHLPRLRELLIACGKTWAVDWTWNHENTLVAMYHDRMVGMVTVWVDRQPYAFVDHLIVDPAYHNEGVGTFLAVAIGKMLRDRGVKVIRVFAESDVVIRGLVKVGGFRIVGKHTILERFD